MSRHRWEPIEGQLRSWRCTNEGCTARKREKPLKRGVRASEYWAKNDAGLDVLFDKAPPCPQPSTGND